MEDLRTGHGITEQNSPQSLQSALPQTATVARWPSSSRPARPVTQEPQIPVSPPPPSTRPQNTAPRADTRPMLNDLRDTGVLVEDNADVAIPIHHRDDVHEDDLPCAGDADLIVARHRDGSTATITVAAQGHPSRFVDRTQP
ncbi:DnaB-like helicase C-terminal domain-containing protein [Streptomyces canarius]